MNAQTAIAMAEIDSSRAKPSSASSRDVSIKAGAARNAVSHHS